MGLIILAIGLALRLYHLTLLPVFADEAIYVRWAQVMANEPQLRFLPLSDGKQPLFMWVAMFIVHRLSDPLFAGRLVSAVAGLGTSVGLFLVSYTLFKSKAVALITSFLWIVSPFAVFFDRMALVDSMLTMFGVWTLFLGIVTAKTKRLDFAMLTGFVLGFAVLTKSSALFFALLLPVTFIFAKNKKDLIKLVLLLIPIYAIAFGMYNIQRLGPNFELLSARTKDYVFPLSKILANPRDPFIYNFPTAIKWLWQIGPSFVLFLGILGFGTNFKKYRKEILIITAWFLVPILVQSAFAKTFTARYILFAIPYFFVLGGSVFLVKKRVLERLSALLLIAFIFHAVWIDSLLLTNPETAPLPRRERSGYLEEWTAGTGIRQVAEFIKDEAKNLASGEQIVVGTEGYFGTLPDGLQIYLEGLPNVIVKGIGVNIARLPEDLRASKKAGNKTYLLINNSRLKAKPEDLGVELLAAYPKALRAPGTLEYETNGPQETLLFFEVRKNPYEVLDKLGL